MRSNQVNQPRAILCMDFDGTLIDHDVHIHPRDVEILSAFPKHIQLVMTTGRNLGSVKSIFQEHGLFTGLPFPLPGVFMNGGLTYQPGEVICHIHPFSPQARQAVINLAVSFSKTAFTFFGIDRVYLVNPNPFGREIGQIHHLTLQETDPAGLPGVIIKVMVLEPDPQMMKQVKQGSRRLPATMATSLPYTYEINPLGINKASSLKSLLKTLNLEDIPIHVAGDAENDLTLFSMAHTSFAPTTSHPKALEHADQLIPRDEDGLLAPILNQINL